MKIRCGKEAIMCTFLVFSLHFALSRKGVGRLKKLAKSRRKKLAKSTLVLTVVRG